MDTYYDCLFLVINYSLRPTLFVMFEKSNILREHHLLFCLPYKKYKFTKLPLNKFINFFLKRIILNEATKKVPQLD